jgi:hypothetical protein
MSDKSLRERFGELMVQPVLVLPPGYDRRGMYFTQPPKGPTNETVNDHPARPDIALDGG